MAGRVGDYQTPPYSLLSTVQNTHTQVLDELERPGVEDVVRKHAAPLRRVISRAMLPQDEGAVLCDAESDEIISVTRQRSATHIGEEASPTRKVFFRSGTQEFPPV
jgi:hypothetical protein